jgi:hypothetical protein
MIPKDVNFLCMQMGDRYPDVYVSRLFNMLRRHVRQPFSLTCIVDGRREIPPEVRTIDASRWSQMRREGMRITTNKIRLFDEEVIPFAEFLYLDVTLVVVKEMTDLLAYAFGRPEDLVIVQDWNYDCYNSCVMRIRSGGALRQVYEAFVAGKTYPHRNAGDQDYIHAAILDHGLQDRVALFRPQDVVSYRDARTVARRDREAGYRELSSATIVKFFGRPKMHEILDPIYNLTKIRLRNPSYGWRDATFWVKELREAWR